MTDPTEEAAMPLDRSALDAGTEAVVDGGTITDSDDQWGPCVPIVPVTVPLVSPAPDAPATATVPSVSSNPDAPAITTLLSLSHNPDAPAITTVPSVSTAIDAPATSPVFFLVTMPSAGSSMGPPVPQIKYAAKPGEGRLLDYASSLRLVSMSAPRFRGGPYGTTTTSSAAASSGGPTNIGGPIAVPAWDQFSTASSSGLSPQEYAELHKGPNWQCCRAQRRLYSTGLSACPRSRGSRLNGGWREIFAGVRKIAPIQARMGRSKAHCGGRISYTPILCQRPRCSYAVLTGGRGANGTGSSKHYGSWHIDQRLGAGSRQTFCNGPRWDYRPINGDRGLDASKLHPKPKRRDRCPSKDARGSPLNGVHKYVAALQRDASVSPGNAIESIGGRGSSWLVSGSTWLVSGSAWSVAGSAWSVTGSAWSVTGSRSCCSGRLCMAWSELCVFCLAEFRMACLFCWLRMKLQFCMSGSSHCDELPRSVLRKLSSLEPGRELFGVAVWILEDLSGRCWMLACSVLRLLCKRRRSPRRRRKSRLLPRFRTLRVRCVRHVVNDDTRRSVIKRSELRAWTKLNQRRAENSDFLRFGSGEASLLQRGAVNHVLAGLPSGAPEGAEPVGESEVEKPVDSAAGVGPIDLDPEEVAIPLTSQALRDHVCRGHQPYLSNCAREDTSSSREVASKGV